MSLFSVIEDQVIIRTSKGVFKQTRIAERDGYAYAKIAGGFIMLYANGTTSNPDHRWVDLQTTRQLTTGSLGRLCIEVKEQVPA